MNPPSPFHSTAREHRPLLRDLRYRAPVAAVAIAALGAAGCAAETTGGDSAEQTGATSQAATSAYLYDFTIDRIWISRTRAPSNDSDVLGVSATVQYPSGLADYGSRPAKLGDLQSQRWYYPNLTLPNVYVVPGTTANFAFALINSGLSAGTGAQVDSALNGISNASHDIASKAYPIPYVWDYLNRGTQAINDFFVEYCDGPVAANRITVDPDTLYAWTAATGSHTEIAAYPGTPSRVGCGATSLYYVEWTVHRQPQQSGGRGAM